MAACYAFIMYRRIYFGGGGGAPGFLTPVVSYAPRPISSVVFPIANMQALVSGLGKNISMTFNMATYRN